MIKNVWSIVIKVGIWLVCAWLFYHSAQISFSNDVDGTDLFRAGFLHGLITNAIIFFGMLYYFPRNERRLSKVFLAQVLILFFGVTGTEVLADELLLGYLEIKPDFRLIWEIRISTVLGNLLMLVLGLFTGLASDWFHQHQLASEIRKQQIKTELELLKSRINPHFLFNVLNSIFYKAQKNGDQETADAIAQLSHMMRYMLHEVTEASTALTGELEYLENYVAMQRMRLVESIPINFNISGDPALLSLPPMLLLPFVENAFKHGVSNANPTPINIQINILSNGLELRVENHIHPCSTSEEGGFGLENAVRRLDLLFPNHYELEAGPEGGQYRVHLKLNLDQDQDQNSRSGLSLKENHP